MKILGFIILSILVYSVLCAIGMYTHFVLRIKKAHINTKRIKLPKFNFITIVANYIHFILALWYGLILYGIMGFVKCLIDNYAAGVMYYMRKINEK